MLIACYAEKTLKQTTRSHLLVSLRMHSLILSSSNLGNSAEIWLNAKGDHETQSTRNLSNLNKFNVFSFAKFKGFYEPC